MPAQSSGASRTAGADLTTPPKRRTNSASSLLIRASSSATRTPRSPSRLCCNTYAHVFLHISSRPLVRDVRNHLFKDTRQIATRHVLENLRAGLCIWARAAADEHVDRIHNLVADLDVLAKQANVGAGMVAAPRRTSRPMHRQQLLARAETRVELTRGFQRQLLCLDERHMAVIDTSAADHTAHHVRRVMA